MTSGAAFAHFSNLGELFAVHACRQADTAKAMTHGGIVEEHPPLEPHYPGIKDTLLIEFPRISDIYHRRTVIQIAIGELHRAKA